jgi:hypothetical protein
MGTFSSIGWVDVAALNLLPKRVSSRRWIRLLVPLAFLPPALPAAAYSFVDCNVVEIVVSGNQNAHVQLRCMPVNLPACAAGNPYFAFDRSTNEGKHYLATVTMAYATGSKVTGWVSASCAPFQNNVALLTHLRVRR